MHQEGHGKDPRPLPARGGSRKWSLGSWRTANSTAGLHQPEQSQRLPVGNAASEQWRMSRRDGALARHPADADLDQDPIQDVALCADDGGDQLPAFVGVPPGEGDRSLSVDQSSDVSGSHRRQSLLTALVHRTQPLKEPAPGRFRPGAVDGGGGGTAGLPLPRQAGLCLHPDLSTGGGACYPRRRRLES
jgi:hypothetical protein